MTHQLRKRKRMSKRNFIIGALVMCVLAAGYGAPARAGLLDDILLSPKTLIDRAIEARSASDIATDNRIVIDVNTIMAEFTTINASTEIYEQRLLITGMFDDKETYQAFRDGVEAVEGVKALYWHATYMSEAEQERRDEELLDWADAMILDSETGLNLIGTAGIADVNFRVAADAFSTIYLIGRARSEEEHDKALRVARETDGVKRVVDYVEVRP